MIKLIGNFKFSFSVMLLLLCTLIFDKTHHLVLSLLAAAAHECGHLVAAALLGVKIKEMRLDLLGACIETESRLTSYFNEWVLCLCGPLASFVASALALDAILLFKMSDSMREGLLFFGVSSAFLGALNLLPVRSFDGGRMLSVSLAAIFGDRVSNIVSEAMSFLCVFVLWSASVYVMLRVGSFLSLFIFSASVFSKIFIKNGREVF